MFYYTQFRIQVQKVFSVSYVVINARFLIYLQG